jgi:DNA-binding transcriptional ArsR family regulator
VVRYVFGQDDLLRTRFAISPLMELAGAFDVVRAPERYDVHRPFADWAEPQLRGLEMEAMDVAMPLDTTWHPDFVSPPPSQPQAQLEDELARVLSTPQEQIDAELARAYRCDVRIPGGTGRLVAEMRAFWDALLAPWWERVLALLEAEIGWRARRLAAVGPQAAFAGLHETVHWHDGALEVTRSGPRNDIDLGGRGLLLVPAAFSWPAVWPMSDPPWQPALVYPPPGAADLWAPGEGGERALEALLGRGRSRVLLSLERPADTQELARRLGASAGGVSEHLGVLRRAGLVTGRREGRRVVYARTAKGDGLVSG